MNKLKQRITNWLNSRTVTWRTVAIAFGSGVVLGLIVAGAAISQSRHVQDERPLLVAGGAAAC